MSSRKYPDSSWLYRLGVSQAQKAKVIGTWAPADTRFIAFDPNFPFSFPFLTVRALFAVALKSVLWYSDCNRLLLKLLHWSPLYGSLTVPTEPCADNYVDPAKCEEWAANGDCDRFPWMKNYCTKSCNMCGSDYGEWNSIFTSEFQKSVSCGQKIRIYNFHLNSDYRTSQKFVGLSNSVDFFLKNSYKCDHL